MIVETQIKKSEMTLEQLLTVKRLEKPAPEFWNQFDTELKERTLRSLVKLKERWYVRLSDKLFIHTRPLFPAAAAAMLMFVLFAGPMQTESGSYATSGLANMRQNSVQGEVPVMRSTSMNRIGANYVQNVIATSGTSEGNFKKVFASQEWKTSGFNGSQMAGRNVVKKASL